MKDVARIATVLFTIFACLACDQISKAIAQTMLEGHGPISYFGGLFSFIYAENAGAMLNLGDSLPSNLRYSLFVVIVGLFLFSITVFVLVKPIGKLSLIAVSLLAGGGFSNLVDRLIHKGLVVDFMFLKIGPLHTGIFNIADVAITAGALILLFSSINH